MSYRQVTPVIMSTVDLPGMCGRFQWKAFGARNGWGFGSATAAWNGQAKKHPGEWPPSGVAVPIWLSWAKDPNGHAAISLADGRVLTSPVRGTSVGQEIYPSIQAMMNAFGGGMTYLGWGEQMDGTVVVEWVSTPVDPRKFDPQVFTPPTPPRQEEDDIMAIYLEATGNSSPLDAGNPGTSRVWAGSNREIGGAVYSGVWERSEDGSVRRLFPGEWQAIQDAYAAAGRKVPVAKISGNELEKMYLVKRAAPSK